MKTRGVAAFLALPILLAVVACGGSSTAASQSVSPTHTKPPSPTTAPTQIPRTLTFKLQPGKRYNAQGTVTIDIKGYGYTMTVSVSGLTPGLHYRIEIAAGTCANVFPDVVLTQDIQPTADGRLVYVSIYPTTTYEIPASSRVLQVRQNIHSYLDDLVVCTHLDY